MAAVTFSLNVASPDWNNLFAIVASSITVNVFPNDTSLATISFPLVTTSVVKLVSANPIPPLIADWGITPEP